MCVTFRNKICHLFDSKLRKKSDATKQGVSRIIIIVDEVIKSNVRFLSSMCLSHSMIHNNVGLSQERIMWTTIRLRIIIIIVFPFTATP